MASSNVHLSHMMIILTVLGMTMPWAVTLVTADTDGNDDMASAEAIPPNGIVTGMVHPFDDPEDHYVFSVDGGEEIELSATNLENSTGNISVELLGPGGMWKSRTEVLGPGDGGRLRFVTSSGHGGSHFIVAKGLDGNNSSYEIEVVLNMREDAGTGGDAPNDLAGAVQLQGDVMTFEGTVGPGVPTSGGTDKNDMYVFHVKEGNDLIFNASVSTPGPELWLELHRNGIGVLPYYRGFLDHKGKLDERRTVVEGTTFYLNVIWENGGGANYTIHIEILETPDVRPPTLTMEDVPEEVTYPDLMLKGTLLDDKGTDKVEVTLDRGGPMVCAGVEDWSCPVVLVEGMNVIVVTGFDLAGKNTTMTIEVRYLPPLVQDHIGINVTSPVEGSSTVFNEVLIISGSVDPVYGPVVRCSTDNGSSWWAGSVEGGHWNCSIKLSEGVNVVLINATDSKGHTNETVRTIKYDRSGVVEDDVDPTSRIWTVIVLLSFIIIMVSLLFFGLGKGQEGLLEDEEIEEDDSEE